MRAELYDYRIERCLRRSPGAALWEMDQGLPRPLAAAPAPVVRVPFAAPYRVTNFWTRIVLAMPAGSKFSDLTQLSRAQFL